MKYLFTIQIQCFIFAAQRCPKPRDSDFCPLDCSLCICTVFLQLIGYSNNRISILSLVQYILENEIYFILFAKE